MKDQYLCLYIFCIFRIRCCKCAMEAHHPCNLGAAARQFKHSCAAKAIANSSNAALVSELMILENLQACHGTDSHKTAVLKIHTGNFGCFFVVLWSYSFSIDVCCKGNVPKFCKLTGAFFYVCPESR